MIPAHDRSSSEEESLVNSPTEGSSVSDKRVPVCAAWTPNRVLEPCRPLPSSASL